MEHLLPPSLLRQLDLLALQRLCRLGVSLAALALAGLCAVLPGQAAAANLMLNPTRIVFDKNLRTAQLDLVNPGDTPLTYRISLVNRRMNEDGEFTTVEQPLPEEKFADQMLRYSPRQVVLAPRQTQTVRIQLRKPADLEPGEYRSHMVFSQIADTNAAPPSPQPTEGTEIKLTPLVGVSVPIIVRHGTTSATVAVANLDVERVLNQPPLLKIELRREGNRSVYGDLIALFTRQGETQAREVGRANGVAVYHPNAVRRARLALDAEALRAPGTLRLLYRERPQDGGKLMAEGQMQLR